MLERYEKVLKITCLVLGAVMLVQLARMVFGRNPLNGVTIPALPALPVTALAKTNSVPGVEKKGTNAVGIGVSQTKETNGLALTKEPITNALSVADTKATNAVSTMKVGEKETNSKSLAIGEGKETNLVAVKDFDKKETNATSAQKLVSKGMSSLPRTGDGKKPINLPPAIQARVDKITQSEILAPVMRPLPMALLGIAGRSAFLRSSNGQTGVVKEGDEVGGLKLLKIGINRVLVEENGEKKELMVFSGLGGESLLPKEKEQKQTNETTKKL